MNEQTIAALEEALLDEYKARATYKKALETFGPTRPFSNIVEAENRHVQALLRQYERLDLTPPADDWEGYIEAPNSIAAACEEAIKAEIENGEMYDRLLPLVDDQAVYEVLLNLQDASQNRHLPAFRRCLERSMC